MHLQGEGRLPGVRGDHLYNLGGFLFAFTVFWSYIGFAQYMLMWYANLPEEIFWYQDRLQGGWHARHRRSGPRALRRSPSSPW